MNQPTDIDALLKGSNQYVRQAAAKLVDGTRLTGNENRRLGRLLGTQQRDHFAGISSAGFRAPGAGADTRRPATEDIEDLDPKLRRGRKAAEETVAAGSGYTEASASDVVGSDGKLLKAVRHSTYAAPSAYPTKLRSVNTGRTVRADDDGLSVEGSEADFRHDPVTGIGGWYKDTRKVEVDFSGTTPGFDFLISIDGLEVAVISMVGSAKVFRVNCGSYDVYVRADGKFVMDNGTAALTIDPALITHNMSVREVDVCDGGVAKKMLIVGSAPY